ncbi:MAG: signal peptidase I [Phycisphaerae bacterium]|nr:signal peptidase I [Phycisphaerae bacterium]
MRLIHTKGGTHYRRWVNPILSFLLPGSAQFLSGQRPRGVVVFVVYLLLVAGLITFVVHPKTAYSIVDMGPFDWFPLLLWLAVSADSLRRPVPRLGFRGWGVFLLVCQGIPILLLLAVWTLLVQPFSVPTGGMQPTIMGNRKDTDGSQLPGDHIFVNKLTYRFSRPQRGDVVVFRTRGLKSVEEDTYYVKRVAGLPGETVGIDAPYLLVNDRRVTEPEIFSRIAEGKDGFSGFCPAIRFSGPEAPLASPSARITLGSDEYLVLGDNTRASRDSRYFGPVKRSTIIGKAFYVYAPAERKRRIE